MRTLGTMTATGLLAATSATAGGLDRSTQRIQPLFEFGNYAEVSFGAFSPDISGTALGASSGNIANGYTQFGAAYKQEISEQSSIAIIFDQPYGASIDYPTGTGYAFSGTTADLSSATISAIYRYAHDSGFSVHGGVRAQQISAEASIPQIAGYSGETSQDNAFGYLVGAAYERPDIALRVALTYYSKIDHGGSVTENSLATGTVTSDLNIETPQAFNLDFETGIAEDTLVFGRVRWVNWSDFSIDPSVYNLLVGQPLVSYADDRWTYSLGVGRRFNHKWAGTAEITYEPSVGGYQSNLGPVDGFFGATLGARYTMDKVTITAGVNVTQIGNTETVINPNPFLTSSFTDNMQIGGSLRIGYSF